VGTPDAGVFWRVIAEHKVKVMFTAPTAFRAIKREDPNAELMKNYDLSNFNSLSGRRAVRSGHPAVGGRRLQGPGHRPLVADGDRLGHLRQLHGSASLSGQGGIAHQAGPGWNLQVVDAGQQAGGTG
jgi:propionyl-CoA synthetase